MADFLNATTLTEQVNKNLPAKRFLSSFFEAEYLLTLDAEIDVVEGTRTLAPFKREGGKGTVSHRPGYGKAKVHCYEIDLKRPTMAFEAFKTRPGEANVNPIMTPDQRVGFMLGQDATDLGNKINRTIEKMCSDAMFVGKYDILDADGKKIDSIDFAPQASHKIVKTGTALWTGNAADVVGDLENLDNVVGEDSGLTVTDKVFGSDAWIAARKNEAFMKDFDRKFMTGNSIDAGAIKNGLGARLVGYHNGSRIWVYDEIYKVGTSKFSFVPKNKVLAISDQISAKLKFGCVGTIEDGFFQGERFARTWYNKDEDIQWYQLKSRPLAVIQEIDGLAWAQVTA